jgi:transposase
VARTQVDRASVSLLARDLKINTNQLFSWRKRFGDETLAARQVNWPPLAATLTLLLARRLP